MFPTSPFTRSEALDSGMREREWRASTELGLLREVIPGYFVDAALLRGAKVPTVTSLARIEPHRLRALVLEDLRRYPASAIGDIHRRIGAELARTQLKRELADLVGRGELQMTGAKRGARYHLAHDG